MFEHTSRYHEIETVTMTMEDGREVTYVKRRFLPQGDEMPLLVETTVQQGERLDQITARTLGAPEQFWRVCDANNAMNPLELVDEAGKTIRIPVPQP
jgi:hypothetical protein